MTHSYVWHDSLYTLIWGNEWTESNFSNLFMRTKPKKRGFIRGLNHRYETWRIGIWNDSFKRRHAWNARCCVWVYESESNASNRFRIPTKILFCRALCKRALWFKGALVSSKKKMASKGVMWQMSVSCHVCIGRVTQECCGVHGIDVWLELLIVTWIIDVWFELLISDLNDWCVTWIIDTQPELLMCNLNCW